MIGKIWKVAKEVAIGILLVLSLWLVIIGAWGKNYMGNLSDWVSSMSTLGTFIVAYLAFKAAPNWIKSKNDEIIHAKATEFYSSFMISYSKLIEKTFPLLDPFKKLAESLNHHAYYNESQQINCIENGDIIRSEFKDIASKFYEFSIFFHNYKWDFKHDVKDDMQTLFEIHKKIELLIEKYLDLYLETSSSHPLMQHEKELFDNRVLTLLDFHQKMYDTLIAGRTITLKIFRSGKSPEEYFTIKNQLN